MAAPFEPVFMPVGVLTAALQELTPRGRSEIRIPTWRSRNGWILRLSSVSIASSCRLPCIPTWPISRPEAMLDPVANTLDLRQPFDESRARRVQAAIDSYRCVAGRYCLFRQPAPRRPGDPTGQARVHAQSDGCRRAARRARRWPASLGGIRRRSMDQNFDRIRGELRPTVESRQGSRPDLSGRAVPDARLDAQRQLPQQHRIYARRMWIALHRIAEKHGVGDQFRIHYDPSHSILMGQDTRSMFQYLADEGYGFLIGGLHVKGQVINSRGVSAWGYGGQTVQSGDWIDGEISPNPADHSKAWLIQTVLAEHELPGTTKHDPLAYLQNRSVDWLDHQLALRELLDIDRAILEIRERSCLGSAGRGPSATPFGSAMICRPQDSVRPGRRSIALSDGLAPIPGRHTLLSMTCLNAARRSRTHSPRRPGTETWSGCPDPSDGMRRME